MTPPILAYSSLEPESPQEQRLRRHLVAPIVVQLAVQLLVVLFTLLFLFHKTIYLELLALQSGHLFLWAFGVAVVMGVVNSGLYVAYFGCVAVQLLASLVSLVWRLERLGRSGHVAQLNTGQLVLAWVLAVLVLASAVVDVVTVAVLMRVHVLVTYRVRLIREHVRQLSGLWRDIHVPPRRVFVRQNRMYLLFALQLIFFYATVVLVLLALWDSFLYQFPLYLEAYHVFQWVFVLTMAVGAERRALQVLSVVLFSGGLLLQTGAWVLHILALGLAQVSAVQQWVGWVVFALDTGQVVLQTVVLVFAVQLMDATRRHTRLIREMLPATRQRQLESLRTESLAPLEDDDFSTDTEALLLAGYGQSLKRRMRFTQRRRTHRRASSTEN